jgi:hypothetical protein
MAIVPYPVPFLVPSLKKGVETRLSQTSRLNGYDFNDIRDLF